MRFGMAWTGPREGRRALRMAAIVGALAVLGAGGCGKADGGGASAGGLTEEAAVARAQAALGPFKKSLKGALMKGLGEGPGPAIEACRDEAPKLAAAASVGGVVVGRSSEKLRNPANAPRAWVAPLLGELAKAPRAPGLHRAVALEGGGWGYVEPIYVDGMCLGCHGGSVGEEVGAKLASLYPEDRARGYAEGDFRGVFWVEVAEGAAR
ncbi:MAG: DUF3365 domain-containing protein [Myxococcales bacterium]|nr:DUF3365 domain-containing protein [Myxococcales bacterium]